MTSNVTLPYTGLTLDRAGRVRTDPDHVEATMAHPDARVVVLWRDRCVVGGSPPRPVSVPVAAVRRLPAAPVFLGRDGDAGVFAVDLTELEETEAVRAVGASAVMDIRRLFPTLAAQHSALLAYARGVLHWHRNQRFCGACGGRTEMRSGGHLLVCLDCGKLLFPRIEPAVITLVEAPDEPRRCLLGRHRGAAEDNYCTLAGFVEIGESLEDAVRREVAEETGVLVGEVHYHGSQAWPFPAGLMVGFRAVATSAGIDVDPNELADAQWFTRDEVARRYLGDHDRRTDSIEHYLVRSWLADTA